MDLDPEERKRLRRMGGVMLHSERTGEPVYIQRPMVLKLVGLVCLYAMLACLVGVVAGVVAWWDPAFDYSIGIALPAVGAVAFGAGVWSLRSRR